MAEPLDARESLAARSGLYARRSPKSEEAIQHARLLKAGGCPIAANPGAESLAWATGLSEAWIVKFWPVFVARVRCVAAGECCGTLRPTLAGNKTRKEVDEAWQEASRN